MAIEDMRLTSALQEFVDENNIGKEIDIDDGKDQSFLFFTTDSEIGELVSCIQVSEDSGYIMIYLIDFKNKIEKKNKNAVLDKINLINLVTKIGSFQLFNDKDSDSDYIRFYLGFPADDVEVNETVIYNLLAECLVAIKTSGNVFRNCSLLER